MNQKNWFKVTDKDCPGHPKLRNSGEVCGKIEKKIVQIVESHSKNS